MGQFVKDGGKSNFFSTSYQEKHKNSGKIFNFALPNFRRFAKRLVTK
jgi:hypothetical protein